MSAPLRTSKFLTAAQAAELIRDGDTVGLMGGGGGLGNSGAMVQMMMAVRAMHGWLMPDVFLNVPGVGSALDEHGEFVNPQLKARSEEFVRKLMKFGKVFAAHIRPELI